MAAKKRRPVGRPPKPAGERTVRASVAIREADWDALKTAARRQRVSVSGVVAQLVRDWLEENGRR